MTVSFEMAGPQVQHELLPVNSKSLQNAKASQLGLDETALHGREKSSDLTVMLAMEGGEGDGSYAKNCRIQADGFRFVKPVLKAVIDGMHLPDKGLVQIADLGCSMGPNSIDHMNLVVNTLRARYAAANQFTTPEFQVFFVDLLSNDFNSLFRLINHGTRAQQSESLSAAAEGVSDYFFSGVPGSFYGRVRPRKSLDVVFSSFSLHWLSKIPDEVQRPESPAYNDGFVWIHDGKDAVGQAYAVQAKSDMCEFLRARAIEMASGGLMFLLLKGRKDSKPTTQYGPDETTMFGKHMEVIFNDLVKEGLLEAKVRDSFNLPIYYRTVDEMKEAVAEVSEFVIERVELLDDVPGNSSTQQELQASPTDCGRRVAKMCRSLLGVLVESHMGVKVANEFFKRLEERAIRRSKEQALKHTVVQLHVNLAILVRK